MEAGWFALGLGFGALCVRLFYSEEVTSLVLARDGWKLIAVHGQDTCAHLISENGHLRAELRQREEESSV